MTRRCIDEHGVAQKLGRTREWFARHKKRLVAELGFPERLPIVRRWDEAAIDAWLERQGEAPGDDKGPPTDWEALLIGRAATIAQRITADDVCHGRQGEQ